VFKKVKPFCAFAFVHISFAFSNTLRQTYFSSFPQAMQRFIFNLGSISFLASLLCVCLFENALADTSWNSTVRAGYGTVGVDKLANYITLATSTAGPLSGTNLTLGILANASQEIQSLLANNLTKVNVAYARKEQGSATILVLSICNASSTAASNSSCYQTGYYGQTTADLQVCSSAVFCPSTKPGEFQVQVDCQGLNPKFVNCKMNLCNNSTMGATSCFAPATTPTPTQAPGRRSGGASPKTSGVVVSFASMAAAWMWMD
jgi:hypothetical protein